MKRNTYEEDPDVFVVGDDAIVNNDKFCNRKLYSDSYNDSMQT